MLSELFRFQPVAPALRSGSYNKNRFLEVLMEKYMKRALELAKIAFSEGEVLSEQLSYAKIREK